MEDQLVSWMAGNKATLAVGLAAYGSGFVSALVVPPADIAVGAFRLAMKFPPFKAAVKRNPDAIKKVIDTMEQAIDAEVDSMAAEKSEG